MRVRFDEAMDWALARRCVRVEMGEGRRVVAGVVEVEEGDWVWSFKPDDPWEQGGGWVMFDAVLEDVAGNQVGRAFDEDVLEVGGDTKGGVDEEAGLPFVLK